MDAASEASRLGADVTLLYRRSKEEMGAYEFEYELIRSVGAKGMFNVSVTEIQGSEKVESVQCVKTKSGENGLEQIEGSEFNLDTDFVIRATGQVKQTHLFDLASLKYDRRGKLVVTESMQCSQPMYFAGGDAVNGGAEVVNACAEGKQAAQGIHEFLKFK